MQKLLPLLFLFAFAAKLYAHDSLQCYQPDPNGRYREHNVDFQKLVLEVTLQPKVGKVIGSANYKFQPIQPNVDTLYLDAPAIKIKEVKLDGKAIEFKSNEAGVTLKFGAKLSWNKSYSLVINYEANPRKGLHFIGWNDPNNLSRKQIWTQGQGIDNRHWFPCYDDVNDRLITETIITFDSTYTVVSNGKLLSKKKNADATFTWHYAMNKPHVPYLLMLAIDKFAYKDVVSNNGIVSRQYYYADRPETFAPTYQYSKEMMDWLPKELGVPYPWEVYANVPVQDFMYGAMENTSATIYTDFYLQDARQALDRNYVATNAHELTHQWFGDLITEWSATHHWLHESFATYYAKLFSRSVYGESQYQWNRRNEYYQARNADDRDKFPVAHSQGGSNRHYPKGSAVIDMLRHVAGDSIYKKAVTHYLEKHKFGNVDTHDFWRAFMECCGMNLDWFFDEWIYHSGYPVFNVQLDTTQNGKLNLYVQQTQSPNESGKLFTMPLKAQVFYTDGTNNVQTALLKGMDTFSFSVNKKVGYVLFDPGDNILKKVTFIKPLNYLASQASSAPNFIDRYDAITALRLFDVEKKKDILLSVFNQENYHPVKTEIIYQLRKEKDEASLILFKKATADKDLNVRKAAVEDIDSIPPVLLTGYEKLLRDSSYTVIEITLRKLCKLYPFQKARYLDITKNIEGSSRNVEIAWLEIKSSIEFEKSVNRLVELTSNSYEFRTRTKAMDALERVDFSNEKLINNLIDATLNPNSRLSNPAQGTIRNFLKQDKFREMFTAIVAMNEWQDWQKKILENLLVKK